MVAQIRRFIYNAWIYVEHRRFSALQNNTDQISVKISSKRYAMKRPNCAEYLSFWVGSCEVDI